MNRLRATLAAALLLLSGASLPETRVIVTLPAGWAGDASGRLLLFAAPATAQNADADQINSAPFGAKDAAVAARDVTGFGEGRSVVIDTEETAFPAGFASLPPGDYRVQAVLDRGRDFNYSGRGPGDLVSKVVTLHWPAATPATIALDHALTGPQLWDFSSYKAEDKAAIETALPALHEVLFQSPTLTTFQGRPQIIKAWVLTPPGYDPKAATTWPTVYTMDGFGGSHRYDMAQAAHTYEYMARGEMPPMIWVYLDHGGPTGTTEFADSVNNGPWGRSLIIDMIPMLERQYRMDAQPSGRFLTGHSSGGWSSLWLQVRYPTVFGGTWSTAPDPADFHDFTGVDLYAPNANFYTDAAGQPRPLIRDKGKVLATIRDFARLEAVEGRDGGQFRSFEWVFSPRCPDGTPCPMFDRETGAVDPAVIAYWRDHYDIAYRIETHWPEMAGALDGKIHLVVGTADTFYLDGAARRLEAAMQKVGAHGSFTYLPGKTHHDLYERGGDRRALLKDIAWQMQAVARPGTKRPARD